jgi:D-inositol-3-phosphate glycosyltransferase
MRDTPLRANEEISVTLLTGGADPPYTFGLGTSLMPHVNAMDLIGSDILDFPAFRNRKQINFLNLRGSQNPDANIIHKILRILRYYVKLICYASEANPRIFHILWNNKFERFDRTILTLYYKALGKRIVLTVHNVNAGRRDYSDTLLNRLTLQFQYRISDHIFVHTEKMKDELIAEFGVNNRCVAVIPFGINNAVPNTALSSTEARSNLAILPNKKVILFFGNITPYKGLEYLLAAFRSLRAQSDDFVLIIAGRPDNCDEYWDPIHDDIREDVEQKRIILKADFVPDSEVEVYFKAADALVLPYRHIYQSGVLFLGYSLGLPVLAADVGSLKDDVVEGNTGFVFKPEDSADLTHTINKYFASELYADLNNRRQKIRDYVEKRHSWDIVAKMTTSVYSSLLASQYS